MCKRTAIDLAEDRAAVHHRLGLLDFRPELSRAYLAALRQGRIVERRAGDGHGGLADVTGQESLRLGPGGTAT